jgi:GntR family transcriptional regulator
MTIDPGTGRPAYQQIAAHLREAIYARELSPGDKLPTERELVERYGTAHGTVRQALEVLKREGLVVSAQGRGVFVRRQPLIHRHGSTRYLRDKRPADSRPFQAEAEREGQHADQRVIAVEHVEPPADVAARLDLSEGEHALVRRHLLLADSIPVATADSYYRLAIAADTALARAERIEGGAHAYLASHLGHSLDHFTEELRAREPTADEVDTLQLRTGECVIRLLRTLYDDHDQAIQVSDHRLAADKYVLVYDVPAR